MPDTDLSCDGSVMDQDFAEETPLTSDNGSIEVEKNMVPYESSVTETDEWARRVPESASYHLNGTNENDGPSQGQNSSGLDCSNPTALQGENIRNHGEVGADEPPKRKSSHLSTLFDDGFDEQDVDQDELNPAEEHVEKARAKVQQYSRYIHLMEERVSILESKIRKIESPSVTIQPKISKPKESHMPAIPELHFVKWFDFKHKYADSKELYSIEVLFGSARYFHNYQTDEQIRKYVARGDVYSEIMSDGNPLATQATYTPGSTDDLPERIRINSHPLLAILSFLSNKDWSMRPRVLLRPFKLLVHFESEIRAYLKKLEDIWSHQPAPQTEGSVARVGSSGSKQADLDEVHSDARASLPIIAPTQNDDEVDSYETLCDLRCLVRFMDKYLVPVSKRFKTASCKKIEFQDLWYLFKPGDEVYAPAPKITTMEINHATSPEKARRLNRYQTSWRVLYVGGGRRALTADEETTPLLESRPHDFTMICYYLDYNGNQFGPTCCNFVIKPFEGSIDITSLEIYPWRFAPKGVAIREKLKKDGELFREFIDTKHLQYDGTSFTHHPCGRPLQVHGAPSHPETIEGQVIVCFEEGAQMDPGWLAPIGFPDELNQFSSEVIESYPTRLWVDRDQSKTTDSWTDMIHADYCIDKLRYTDLVESDPLLRAWEARFLNESNEEDRELREEDLILLPTRILAYVFRERKFALLNLHNLRKCRTDVDGFQNLKLPKGYKKMVKSLVLTHFLKKKASLGWGRHDTLDFDVVYGKSRGLIILLHGVPGVGKTSTAECVAEATGKPLFPITCGDLGLTPERVEKTLRETFHLAQLWDCVLLLDEADIFLAQRTKTDLQRNALVSVFLRVLEYYSGILFLTTNRVGVIDEAFKSRIHVTLLYPELTPKQTQAIWRMNLDRLRKIDRERAERAHDPEMIIDENKIMDFQKRHSEECWKNRRTWNGRQIRNAFQTASALALFDAHQANINRFEGQENADKAVPDLKIEYFEKVDKASSDFDMYISEVAGVGGKNDGDRALARGERADHLRFHRGGPLESQTELRAAPPAGTRRTPSFSQEGFRQQPQPPTYSSVHMHHREQQYGPSPRASSTHFDTVLSNTFDSRGLNGGFYPHSPPKQGSESPIYSTGMPQEMDPRHLARQNSFNEYDEDDD